MEKKNKIILVLSVLLLVSWVFMFRFDRRNMELEQEVNSERIKAGFLQARLQIAQDTLDGKDKNELEVEDY